MAQQRPNTAKQDYLTRPDGLATALRGGRGAHSMAAFADLVAAAWPDSPFKWNSSRVSKLENGFLDPTAAIVDHWARAAGVSDEEHERWTSLLSAFEARADLRSRRSKTSVEEVEAKLAATATLITFVGMLAVPEPLRMPGYAAALDTINGDESPRTNLLDGERNVHILLGEAALRYAPNSLTVMPAQLDKLLSATDLDHVRLGIIPELTGLHRLPDTAAFALYRTGKTATGISRGHAGPAVVDGDAAKRLQETIDALWLDAVVGDQARALILKAKADIAAARNRYPKEGDYVPEEATKPEREPIAAAVVVSERGVLLGRRHDGVPLWTFIAGELEPGESIADAAVREVKEETGLLVTAGEREIGRRVHPKTGRTMIYLPCRPEGKLDVFVGDEDELAEVRWVTEAEIDGLMENMYEPVREYLRREMR